MTLKLAKFCDDPKKISTKSSYPKKIFIFLKTQKNIEIQNFDPKKMGRAYVCSKISEYPPWAGKSTYTYTQAHPSLHCSTLRQIPKSNGLIPLICSFVTSKSILFDLKYAKNY